MENPEAPADRAEPPAGENAPGYPDIFDVAVLGGGLPAGLLGAVLARQGVRVLLADAPGDGPEPSGETTVPYTAEVFTLLARRFGVPEIAAFGLFADLPPHVRATSGVNRSLSHLYHRPGRRQDPRECVQFIVPGEHSEWHPYRPDVDAYARALAVRYGAAVLPDGTGAADAWTEEDAAVVLADDGRRWRARYVVDACGAGSPLVRRHGGDDARPRLRHRSRVHSTHMRGVLPFEDVVPLSRYRRMTAWSHGTVSHLFDGGWLQLAAFGNHREGLNPLTGVTLSLDPERWPGLPDDPGEAFRAVVGRYPDLARQFAGASAVRAWTSEPLWQRTAARGSGPRWFALGSSAARNDLFLARDVTMGAEVVHALASVLVPAARSGDWSQEPFDRVCAFQEELERFNDRLLCAARTACGDFRLWNAFCRVWLVWQQLAHLSLRRARLDCEAGGADWSPVQRFELGGMWFEVPAGLRELVDACLTAVEEAGSGRLAPRAAARRIFAALRRGPFVPPLHILKNPRVRVYHYTLPQRLRMLLWLRTRAPSDFRALLTRENVMTTRPPAASAAPAAPSPRPEAARPQSDRPESARPTR